jgi:hypothetical protein
MWSADQIGKWLFYAALIAGCGGAFLHARRRGRSGAASAVLVFMLGPFSLLAWPLFRPRRGQAYGGGLPGRPAQRQYPPTAIRPEQYDDEDEGRWFWWAVVALLLLIAGGMVLGLERHGRFSSSSSAPAETKNGSVMNCPSDAKLLGR